MATNLANLVHEPTPQQRDSSRSTLADNLQRDPIRAGGNIGWARPQAGTTLVGDGEGSSRAREFIRLFLGDAYKLTQEYTTRNLQNKYLQGSNAAAAGLSEEMLEDNTITRNWMVAGHRDTVGRLLLAESEANLAKDMKRLREGSPEEMKQYLNQRREKMSPVFSGMSYQGREQAFGKLLVNDQSAMATYTTERAKFIIEEQTKALQVSTNEAMARLGSARDSGSYLEYEAARNKSIAQLYTDVLSNQYFDDSLKQKLTTEYMELALANDHVDLYQFLRDNSIQRSNGEEFNVLATLSLDDQEKIAGKYREAMGRVRLKRNLDYSLQKAEIQAAMETGTYNLNAPQLRAFIEEGVMSEALTQSGVESLWKQHNAYWGSSNNQEGLAAAAIQGDTLSMLRMGASPSRAVDALVQQAAKAGATTSEIAGQLIVSGTNGVSQAWTKLGDIIAPSVWQLGREGGTLDPQHEALLNSVMKGLEVDEAAGRTDSVARLLEGMPAETATRFMSFWENMRYVGDARQALNRTLENEAKLAGLTTSQRAAMTASRNKEDVDFVNSIDARGWFGALGLNIRSAFGSGTAQAIKATTPYDGWNNSEKALEAAVVTTRTALLQEMNTIGFANPLGSSGQRQQEALAAVMRRTISTDLGPVILPQGSTVQSLFGVDSRVSKELVGRAIEQTVDDIYKSKQEHQRPDTVVFQYSQGVFTLEGYKADGEELLFKETISPNQIKTSLDFLMQDESLTQDQQFGRGRTVKRTNGSVTFNGENAAGADPAWMLKYRDNLVQNEDIRQIVYADSKGIPTFGVGISNRSKFWQKGLTVGDSVSQEMINQTFRAATNEAATAGMGIMDSYGLQSEAAFLLASELAYQSGPNHNSASFPSYQKMYSAIAQGDTKTALNAFLGTPAGMVSGNTRKRHYLNLIREASKDGANVRRGDQ